jgi:hypothetical protein
VVGCTRLTDYGTGLFYGGFGAALYLPSFGVESAYAGNEVQYNNSLGFFMARKLPIVPTRSFKHVCV